jgi:hypothetical protein
MTKTRLIGDIHGQWLNYLNLVHDPRNRATQSIQVGDFGLGFGEREEHKEYVREEMQKNGSHRFIRGNHDNPELCKEHSQFIKDGSFEGSTMFVGGARSSDQHHRIEGVSWWPEEELSHDELSVVIADYEMKKPKVLITHDCPDSVARHLFSFYTDSVNESRTRQAFDVMFHHVGHRPDLWVFGHWHESKRVNIMGTEFICLGIDETFDIDL